MILMMLGVILDHYGLFPRRLFAWVTVAFGWISDDPFTRRLQFYFITIVVVGVWFVFRLARLGVFGTSSSACGMARRLPYDSKNRQANRSR